MCSPKASIPKASIPKGTAEMIRVQPVLHTLRKLCLWVKLLFLLSGAVLFFFLFPFLLRQGVQRIWILLPVLIGLGILFRITAGKRTFRITLWLWAGGSIIYLAIAVVLVLKRVQPLPYMDLQGASLAVYYLSYPLRLLGIFFTGLIFASITSPAEFIKWGEAGMRIALAYRAFEYSVNSLNQIREALIIQGEWAESGRGRGTGGYKMLFRLIKSAPLLVAVTFRNIILWFPWAWICYRNLRMQMSKRRTS